MPIKRKRLQTDMNKVGIKSNFPLRRREVYINDRKGGKGGGNFRSYHDNST